METDAYREIEPGAKVQGPKPRSREVENVLMAYESMGLSRIQAITAALREEKIERDVYGHLRLRSKALQPGRQLLGI